jgi:hypothetical protein
MSFLMLSREKRGCALSFTYVCRAIRRSYGRRIHQRQLRAYPKIISEAAEKSGIKAFASAISEFWDML